MSVFLADNRYGESRVRLVKVSRRSTRHEVKELSVAIQFRGDFDLAHTAGDNRNVLPTETLKNAVYALAKDDPQETGEEQIEQFGVRLVEYFLSGNPQLSEARVEITETPWAHIISGGKLQQQSFTRGSQERRIASVTGTREATSIAAGIEELVVLKTAGSTSEGYREDPFGAQSPAGSGLLATAVNARWLYTTADTAFGPCWHGVRQIILDTFAEHHSRSVQNTLYLMGETVLNTYDEISEIHFSLPSRGFTLVDLSRFGLENNNEVFVPTEEPHALIEATIKKRQS